MPVYRFPLNYDQRAVCQVCQAAFSLKTTHDSKTSFLYLLFFSFFSGHFEVLVTGRKLLAEYPLFVYLSLILSVYLSLYLPLPLCLSGCLSFCLSVYLSLCLSLSFSLCLCVWFCLSLCFSLSLCMSLSLCLCLYVCLSACLPFFLCLYLCHSVSLQLKRVLSVWLHMLQYAILFLISANRTFLANNWTEQHFLYLILCDC